MLIATSFGAIRPWNGHDSTALVKFANNRNVWLNMRDAFRIRIRRPAQRPSWKW